MSHSSEHTWAIDSIEEGIARVEEDGKRMLSVPRALLPPDAREGVLLRVTRAEAKGVVTLTMVVDSAATAAALARSAASTRAASAASRKRDPGGDVSL